MGSRFVQVDLDYVDSKANGIFAARLGIDRDAAAGKMLRAWGWAVAQAIKAPDDDPIRAGIVVGDVAEMLISDAARWPGDPTEFTEAGVAAGLLARGKKGVRFMGWEERYGAMLKKLRRDAQKPDGRSKAPPARDSRGSGEGVERDSGGQIVDRRSQIVEPRDLDHLSREEPKAEVDRSIQPPDDRKLSWQELIFEEVQISRVARLARDGTPIEPESVHPALINKVFGRIAAAAGGDKEAPLRLFDAYLELDWPAAKKPPYAFQVFASEKVWPKLLDQIKPADEEAH